jgi:hypothetical protein
MDQDTFNNWKKIKSIMEERGTTENQFYKRAVVIVKTGKDPLAKFLGDEK